MIDKPTVTSQDLIDQARTYLGVSYRNQGRDSFGLDCGGFLLVIGRELGLTQLEWLGYANSPDGETFERLLNENCLRIETEELTPGFIIAMDYSRKGERFGIQHVSIVTETEPRIKVIHAKRLRGVVETYLYDRDKWAFEFRRHVFAIPGVAYA